MPSECQPCQGIEPRTPESVANRPGLPALRYRAGRHGTFLESMIARLSAVYAKRQSDLADAHPDPRTRPEAPPWLHTREPGDPSIALLDAWATVGDILTFYQERIANEGYLKTARERRSLHELANQVGYQLRPALSASVYLAFDVQAPPSLDPEAKVPPPHEIKIPKGTQAKSIPEPGELPAIFETTEEFTARPEWNALKPRMTRPTVIDMGTEDRLGTAFNMRKLRFQRTDHNLRAGDYLLLVEAVSNAVRPGTLPRQIEKVDLDQIRNQTVVTLVDSFFSTTRYREGIQGAARSFEFTASSQNLNSPDLEERRKNWLEQTSVVRGFFDAKKTLAEADKQVWNSLKEFKKPEYTWEELAANYRFVVANPIADWSVGGQPSVEAVAIAATTSGETRRKAVFDAALLSIPSIRSFLRVLSDNALTLLAGSPELLGEHPEQVIEDEILTPLRFHHLDIAVPSTRERLYGVVANLERAKTLAGSMLNFRQPALDAILPPAGAMSPPDTDLEINAKLQNVIDAFEDGASVEQSLTALLNPGPANSQFAAPFDELVPQAEAVDKCANAANFVGNSSNASFKAFATDIASEVAASRDLTLSAIHERVQAAREEVDRTLPYLARDHRKELKEALPNASAGSPLRDAIVLFHGTSTQYAAAIPRILAAQGGILAIVQAAKELTQTWREASVPFLDGVLKELASAAALIPATSVNLALVQQLRDLIGEVETLHDADESEIGSRFGDLETLLAAPLPAGGDREIILIRTRRLLAALATEFFAEAAPRKLTRLSDAGQIAGVLQRTAEGHLATPSSDADLSTRLARAMGNRENQRTVGVWGNLRDDRGRGKVFAFRVKASLFGSSQPQEIQSVSKETIAGKNGELSHIVDPVQTAEDEGNSLLHLDHDYADVSQGGWCLISTKISGDPELFVTARISEGQTIQRNAYKTSGKSTRVVLDSPWQTLVQPTGSSNPEDSIAAAESAALRAETKANAAGDNPATRRVKDAVTAMRAAVRAARAALAGSALAQQDFTTAADAAKATSKEASSLAAGLPQATAEAVAEVDIATKAVAELTVVVAGGLAAAVNAFRDRLRSTVVFAGSVELPLVDEILETPYPTKSASQTGQDELVGNRFKESDSFELDEFYPELAVGRDLIIAGELVIPQEGNPGGQLTGVTAAVPCKVVAAEHEPEQSIRVATRLTVSPPIDVRFKRETVRIYANVAQATHGEIQNEVLGSGEGQGEFQQFALSSRGLTFLPEATPTGMAPQVSVRVNNVAWARAEKVGNMQPAAEEPMPREYLATVDDDQRAILTTGDGKTTGERLPTGVANVTVEYRVGGGTGGNVKEGTITQLPSPPLNVTKVRNLLPASGGVDRENVEQARGNVALATMALDRLLSMRDYESFVRKFAGIAKAEAISLVLDGAKSVVVTIAGLEDAPIERDSLLFTNLDKALRRHSDPEQSVVLVVRELMLLILRAKVKIRPEFLWEPVRLEILRRLLQEFDFEKARLGGRILLSDVVAVIQETPGVRYVDVDVFDRMRQFYGPGELVRKAACIAKTKGPKLEIGSQSARPIDVDVDNLILNPVDGKTAEELLKEQSFVKDEDHLVLPLHLPDGTNVVDDPSRKLERQVVAKVRIFTKSRPAKPPNATSGAKSADPFPAQLAYFSDLPGTILLEQIP